MVEAVICGASSADPDPLRVTSADAVYPTRSEAFSAAPWGPGAQPQQAP